MADIIIEIATFLFRVLFEIVFSWTGEIVLFLVTFGKHRPRWNLYTDESAGKFVLFSEVSLWIGIAFWVFVVALLYFILNR